MTVFDFALVVGILLGVIICLVIFSLLTMAQRGDAYLENWACLDERGYRFEKGPVNGAEGLEKAFPEPSYPGPEAHRSTQLT